MVEIYVEDQKLDVPQGLEIKYTKQIGDVFDLPAVKSSFTNSFGIPKTDRNLGIFEGVGLVGNASELPYRKVHTRVVDNGATIIESGWLNLISTEEEEYKIAVIDGAIDFFKAIEGKSLADLDLSAFDHQRTIDVVTKSWRYNRPYTYVIADYGADLYKNSGYHDFLNIDSLLPALRVKELLKRCFEQFGFKFKKFYDDNGKWLVYPAIDVKDEEYLRLEYTSEQNLREVMRNGEHVMLAPTKGVDVKKVMRGRLERDKYYVVPYTGLYRLDIYMEGRAHYLEITHREWAVKYYIGVKIYVNNRQVEWYYIKDQDSRRHEISLNKGDRLHTELFVNALHKASWWYEYQWSMIKKFSVSLHHIGSRTGGFRGLKSFSIKDFIKDTLLRNAQCIIPKGGNTFEFCNLSDRLSKGRAIDLTAKYVRRVRESYLMGSYGQNNYIRHKYALGDEGYDDGCLHIDNVNLPIEKTIYESNIYAPGVEVYELRSSITDKVLYDSGRLRAAYKKCPVWERNGDNLELKDDRYYIINSTSYVTPKLRIYSAKVGYHKDLENIRLDCMSRESTSYKNCIGKYYKQFARDVLNDCKIHVIEVRLDAVDLGEIPFDRPVYFGQEASYYLVNKVEYRPGGFSTMELLIINN